ncbi:YdgA family protein [uncultured Castellaniella sp.]|uniref:YdgA family protein n=1 Tax=uncultured Castellaniella sp. TaxID=647907 RepID=UPI0026330C75|nr:YdgA family protein [uncultured Castellaniella sp.]
MNRRLSLAAGAVAVLVLAYGSASWYAGRVTQQSIESWVSQANQDIKAQWASDEAPPVLRVDEYQRGLFSSQVRYVFEFRDDKGAAQAVSLQDDLQHGPWPLAAVREGHWGPLAAYSRVRPLPGGPWQPWFAAVGDGTTAPWQADSRVGFDGRVASLVTLKPARTPDKRIDFSGGTMRVVYQPETRHVSLSAQAKSLDVQDADLAVRFHGEDLRLDSDTTRSGETDLQSRQELKFAQLRITDGDNPEIRFTQPSMRAETARTGSLLDSRVQYDLGQLQAGGQDLGAIRLKASAEQLDVQALQALLVALDQTRAGKDDDAPLSPEDEQRLRPLAMAVLASSPRVSLDEFSWTTPKGKTDARALAQFRPAADDAPQDLGALLERGIGQLTAHAGVSKPMLLDILARSQAGANPDMMVALVSMLFDQYSGRLARAGLVKEQDGQVQADVSYADGKVTVNGQPMAPEALAALVGGALGLGQ